MGMEPSLDPDITCDVQMSKNALPETCSVLEPRGADALCWETMKAWHHLWHSLGSKQFGKGTSSSPLDKYDFVTPSQ